MHQPGPAVTIGSALSHYLEWNDVLAETMFPTLEAAEPVYLSVIDEKRELLEHTLGLEAGTFERALADCIVPILRVGDGPTQMFRNINAELSRWRRRNAGTRGAPPVLPVLTMLTASAERMASGEGMSEANFYGRVLEFLGLDDPKHHFEQGYRRFGEGYWRALQGWLEYHDGFRGMPTASAVGHRFVGLPISQVLIRASDRARLPTFFQKAGLPPGAVVPSSELSTSFADWISSVPSPVSHFLARHWRNESTQPQILEAVATALALWDGHLPQAAEGSTAQCSLALNIGSFPRRRLDVSPVVHISSGASRPARLETTSGWQEVALTPFAPGIMRIGEPQAFDNQSLFEGVLHVEDDESGIQITRHPRRILVFRRVELAGAYLEAEQVLLGEDVFIVVRDQPNLISKTEAVLTSCARPGWERLPDSFPGVPTGWIIYRNVQIMSHPGDLIRDSDVDLGPLVPLTNSQLTVGGGFTLPGSSRGKWHRDKLPELRAMSDNPRGFTVRLLDFDADSDGTNSPLVLEEWKSSSDPLVVDLATLELDDGNYRIELRLAGTTDPVSALTLRVRSSDAPDWDQLERFNPADQFLEDPLSVLSASAPMDLEAVSLTGSILRNADAQALGDWKVSPVATWQTERSRRAKSSLRIQTVPEDSCLYTGRHNTILEPAILDSKGRSKTPFVLGTCQQCGLTRKHPSTPYWAKRLAARREKVRPALNGTDTRHLAPAQKEKPDVKWDVVLDGVLHTQAGTRSTFEKLAMFVEPSALMYDHLIRTLFSLGHIDVMRDEKTLETTNWEVVTTSLAPTAEGYYLSGFWTRAMREAHLKGNPDVRLKRIPQAEGPSSYYFSRLPDVLDDGVTVGASAEEIASHLPPLGQVVAALPRVACHTPESGVTIFDPRIAKWQDASGMGAIGGYRIRRFRTDDVLRTPIDIENGTMGVSTVHLSKHATALLWGHPPLLAYDSESQVLSVPLGANLPWLYEKVAVLASGLVPVASTGSLHYRSISPELAGHLAHLLAH